MRRLRNLACKHAAGIVLRWRRAGLGCLTLLVWFAVASGTSADEPRTIREIFVPFDALEVLLEGDAQRVFLTREEYEALVRRAERAPDEQAPRDVVVAAADYEGTIVDGRATMVGRLEIEVLADRLHAVPLEFSGVGIRRATLDGRPAALGSDAGKRVVLFVKGTGRHQLEVELTTPLQTAAAQQSLQFQVPTPPATRMRLTAPGNVEVRSGAAVAGRTVAPDGTRTTFDLLPPRGPLALVLSLNNRQLLQQRLVVARSVMVGEVTQAYQRLHATVSLGVLHGAIDQLRFEVPAGFEVTEVASPLLSRWQVATGDAADQPRVLEVTLREPTTETVVLNVSAVTEQPADENWSLPRLVPLDVASHVAVVGLLVDERLSAEAISARGLTPINNRVLRSRLPATVFDATPGLPRVREVVAYYAPDAEFELTARFVRPPARVSAVTHWLLVLDDQRQTVRGGFAVTPTAEPLFAVDIVQPAGWTIEEVTTADGTALPFESIQAADGVSAVRARLPRGVAPGTSYEVLFSAFAVPDGWLDDWTERAVPLPTLRVLGADRDRGAIAVQASGDLSVRPEQVDGLAPLDANEKTQFGLSDAPTSLAYRYDAQPYSGVLQVSRKTPWVTARSYNFLRIEPQGLTAHYELVFEVSRAHAQRLQFTLPATTPAVLSVRGLGGVEVKEYRGEVDGDVRRWTVLLANRRLGDIRVAVDWEQPLPGETPRDWQLPMVKAEGVQYQSALVAVEGSPDFDVELATDGRKVDVGELAEAGQLVGPRLLGAFGFFDGDAEITANVFRRPGYGLPEAIIQRAELVTLGSTTGRCQTAARYLLRTKAAYLEIALPDPDRTQLWSAIVDGVPAAPQRDGDQLLLSLPAKSGDPVRDLQIVYESASDVVTVIGDVQVAAPRLMVRNETGDERYEVPTADVQWTFVLPSGHRVVRSSGGVTPIRDDARWLEPARRVGKALFLLGGGFQSWFRIRARMAARSALDTAASSGSIETDDAMFGAERLLPPSDGMGGMGGGARGPRSAAADESRPQAAEEPPLEEMDTPAPPMAAPATPAPAEPMDDAFGEASPLPGRLAGETATAGGEADAAQQFWALEGVRSLQIELQARGDEVRFEGMGDHPRLQVTLVRDARLRFLGWGAALVVILVGLAMTASSTAGKARFVIGSAVLALVLPLVVGAILNFDLGDTFAPVLYAACLLIPYYLLAATWPWLRGAIGGAWRRWRRSGATRPATTALLLILAAAALASTARAQGPTNAQFDDLINLLRPPQPVRLPEDAVIIPYDGDDPQQARQADKVLVPYERYKELWKLAYPDQPLGDAQLPAPFAWAGGSYEATLLDGESLTLTGRFEVDVFADDPVDVPLGLRDAVLTRVVVDGQPAPIRVVVPSTPVAPQAAPNQMPVNAPPSPPNQAALQGLFDGAGQPNSDPFANPPAEPMQQAEAPMQQAVNAPVEPIPPVEPEAIAVVRLQGRGRRALEISLRLRIERSGGWRIVKGIVPSAPAAALTLAVPAAETEVRLAGVQDRSNYETEQDNQSIATALGPNGTLQLEWRPKVAAGEINQSLTARSNGVLDVREDGLLLTWQLQLDLGATPREAVTLAMPAGWLIESVRGDNVRGWEAGGDEDANAVEIRLLKAATGQESVTLRLSRRLAIGQTGPSRFAVPVVGVPNAVLHQGHLAVRRSPRLDVRTEQAQGVARAELTPELESLMAAMSDESPLGIRPFQTFRFASPSYTIDLTAVAYPPQVTAQIQALLRIGQRDVNYEARLLLQSPQRPLHEVRCLLPVGFELDRVDASGPFESAVTQQDDRSLLTVYLAEGYVEGLSIIVAGRLPSVVDDTLPVPRLDVQQTVSQRGHLVVQTDPAIGVTVEQPRGCRVVPVAGVASWLAPEQQSLTRVVLAHDSADFDAVLRTDLVQPVVNVVTITNARVTLRDVEETLFLRFQIQRAGVREVAFLAPARLREAVVKAPLLRQFIIEDVEGRPDAIRIRVELQDEVTGELIVLVENDRALTGDIQAAPIPTVETGTTLARYVVLENAGRDEVLVEETTDVSELRREDPKWRMLAAVLGDKITQAFVANGDAVEPRLTYRTRRRSVVETAGATIRLAETVMAVDADGVYRASQIYRLDNQTEQALEIELPAGAELWTATVAGQPVKPTTVPNATSDRFVRIPLIKTAPGDLDFAVVLKYGGRIDGFQPLPAIQFPLVRTVNVNVELSQVRLYLPRTQRFFDFGGTLRLAADEGDMQAGYLAYRNRQLESLLSVLSGGGDVVSFSQMRATANLKQLTLSTQDYDQSFRKYFSNEQVQEQLTANSMIVRDAQRRLAEAEGLGYVGEATDNRARFDAVFEAQESSRATGVVTQLGTNFDVAKGLTDKPPALADDISFNSIWLDASGLKAADGEERGSVVDRDDEAATKRLAATKPAAGKTPGGESKAEEQPRFGNYAKEAAEKAVVELESNRRGEVRQQFERYQSQLETQQQLQSAGQSGSSNRQFGQPPAAAFEGARVGRQADFAGPQRRTDGLDQAEFALGDAVQVAADSGLVSLDVELPQRGDVYLFTTPGGDLQITARAVDAGQFDRLIQLALVLGGLLLLWLAYRVLRLLHERLSRRMQSALLIICGTLSLLSGILPIAGLVVLLVGIARLVK